MEIKEFKTTFDYINKRCSEYVSIHFPEAEYLYFEFNDNNDIWAVYNTNAEIYPSYVNKVKICDDDLDKTTILSEKYAEVLESRERILEQKRTNNILKNIESPEDALKMIEAIKLKYSI